VLQLYLYARVRFFALIAHETAGAASTRHSLRPLLSWRMILQTSGAARREIAETYLVCWRSLYLRHPEERALARVSKGDSHQRGLILRGSLRSHLRMTDQRWIASLAMTVLAQNDGPSTQNNSQQIAPASEWRLRLRLSALILHDVLLNRRP
jgi:hypothetical protein